MGTLINNSIVGFRTHAAIHQYSVLPLESQKFRMNRPASALTVARYRKVIPTGSRISMLESQPTPTEPETPELPEEDFPFSALLRLVRQMRQ
jgi:hypothetical protein